MTDEKKKKGKGKKGSDGSDFNDLALVAGNDVVGDQLREAVDSSDSPGPPKTVGRFTAADCLKRFALVFPSGGVFDLTTSELLKKTVFRSLVGAEVFKAWEEAPERGSIAESEISRVIASAQFHGESNLSKALRRYIYIEPSSDVFDSERRERVPISDLRNAIADVFPFWLTHPSRRMVEKEKLVFDPTGQVSEEDGYINFFRGLPLKPVKGNAKACGSILRMIHRLVNYNDEAFEWLMCWLALPLQKPGAKMATAVLMHSETEGSGKSLLFDLVMRTIYGEYSATLGQHQLESQYTDWRSQKLFCLFEEIFSRDQKYQHTGTIKHMITGATQRIEQKFVSGWEEANYMNAVFLSNEIQPFPIGDSDRRHFVVWPRETLPADEQKAVIDSIHNGGIEAFYGHLLDLDLRDFHEHTKPVMTEAKERLIEFGRPSWEIFYFEWRRDALKVPYMPCLTEDLFKVYISWCSDNKEKHISQSKFSQLVSTRQDVSKRPDMRYDGGIKDFKGTFFLVSRKGDQGIDLEETDEIRGMDILSPESGEKKSVWLGRCVKRFRMAMGELSE